MFKSFLLAGLAATFFSVAGAAPAQATVLDFDLSVSNGADTTWTEPSSPTPAFYDSTETRIAGSFTGTYSAAPYVTFLISGSNYTVSFGSNTFSGPQIFTGTTAAPTFAIGTFNLTGYSRAISGDPAVLTITAAAVPEAATWAMMLVGLGVVGTVARRRQVVRIAYA